MQAIAVGKQTVTLNGKPVHPGWIFVWSTDGGRHFVDKSGRPVYYPLAGEDVEVTNELEYLDLDGFN